MKNIILMVVIIFYLNLSATIINVPDDQPTIQEGLNEAEESDSVLVAAGTYSENIIWPTTNGIKLIGSGEDNCIIDGNSLTSVIRFENNYGLIDETTVIIGFTIQNGYAQGNEHYRFGGGIYCYYASPSLENLTITSNSAIYSGGGVFCFNYSHVSFEDVIITENLAPYGGGGICCDFTSNSTLTNVIVMDNTSISGAGGGISIQGGSYVEISYTLISDNSAVIGGGVFCGGKGESSLTNCSVINNSASNDGGGVYSVSYYSDPNLVNCILWDDSPNEIFGSVYIYYSDIQNGWAGIGNIDADPLFVDAANGDYHLTANSPCIDAGDPMSPYDPDGTIADMGAYYYDQGTGTENYELQVSNFKLTNYPNPFNPITTIEYSIPQEFKVEFKIYNIKGQKVKTLVDEQLQQGKYSVIWDGRYSNGDPVNSGIYFYKLSLNGKTEAVKKCLLLK